MKSSIRQGSNSIFPTTYSKARQTLNKRSKSKAFTIVELLVVIVVIGILAAITIVSYTGISSKAVSSALQSDLSNAKKQLALYQIDHSAYPTPPLTITGNSYCPSDDTKYCFKLSNNNNYIGYSANNSSSSQSFFLIIGNGNQSYKITNTTTPQLAPVTQPGVTPGAVLELIASKAKTGTTPGINSPLTTTWTDTSGNNNNGTLTGFTGTPWLGVGTLADPYALLFSADNVNAGDRVILPLFQIAKSFGWTYEVWVKTPSSAPAWLGGLFTEATGTIAGKPTYQMATIAIQMNGTAAVTWRNADNIGSVNAVSTASVCNGQIHHLLFSYDPVAGGRLYNDGVQQNATPTGAPSDLIDYTSVAIGASGWSSSQYFLGGSVISARAYSFGLSSSQVAANYSAGPIW